MIGKQAIASFRENLVWRELETKEPNNNVAMYANNPGLLKGFKVANKDKCEQCHKPRQRDIYDYCYKPRHIKTDC